MPTRLQPYVRCSLTQANRAGLVEFRRQIARHHHPRAPTTHAATRHAATRHAATRHAAAAATGALAALAAFTAFAASW